MAGMRGNRLVWQGEAGGWPRLLKEENVKVRVVLEQTPQGMRVSLEWCDRDLLGGEKWMEASTSRPDDEGKWARELLAKAVEALVDAAGGP